MTTVLNTRPQEQAAELSSLLRAGGLTPVEAPAIATLTSWAPAELESVRRDLRRGQYAWVVLASANAGRGLASLLDGIRVCCGTSTAQALGIQAAIGLDRFSAAGALAALRSVVRPGDRVLLPRAAEGRDDLHDGLRHLGADVDAPVAYRTVACSAAAQRLERGGVEIVTVCSPSAVSALRPALERHLLVPVVALGDTTAAALRSASLPIAAVASQTSMRALVDAVKSVVWSVPA